MRFILVLFLIACVGSVSLLGQTTQRNPEFSLSQNLPERTLVVAGVPNVQAVKQAFDKSLLYKFSKDEEVRRFIIPIYTMFEPKIQEGLKQFESQVGVSLDKALGMASGEILIAIVDVDFTDRVVPLGALFAIQVGNEKETAMHFLKIAEGATQAKFVEKQFQGISTYDISGTPLSYAFIGNTLVFATKEALLQEIILNHVGKGKDPLLKDNASFRATRELLAPKNEVCAFGLYVNIESVFAKFGPILPPNVLKIVQNVKLQEIRALALSINLAGKDLHTSFYLHAPGAKEGVHKLYRTNTVKIQNMAKHAPGFALSFSCGNLELTQFFNAVEEIIHLADPNEQLGLFSKYQQGLDFVQEKSGINLKKDLAQAFQGESFSTSFYLPHGGFFPESVSGMTTTNKEAAQKCMKAFAKALDLEEKTVQVGGKTFYYLVTPLGRLGENPFQKMERAKDPVSAVRTALSYGLSGFAYAYEGNIFYMGQTVQSLSYYLSWKASSKNTLAQKKDLLTRLPKGQVLSFLYYDTRPVVQELYNTFRYLIRIFEGYIRGAGVPLETALFPRPHVLASYFEPGTISLTLEKDGVLLSSRGSIDVAVGTVALVGITAAVAVPAIQKAQEKAMQAAATAQLKSIYIAITMYEAGYNKFPPEGEQMLHELISKQFISADALLTPQHRKYGWPEATSYECTKIPLAFSKDKPHFPIIWEKYPTGGYQMVLYANGAIQKEYEYSFKWKLEDAQREYQNSQPTATPEETPTPTPEEKVTEETPTPTPEENVTEETPTPTPEESSTTEEPASPRNPEEHSNDSEE